MPQSLSSCRLLALSTIIASAFYLGVGHDAKPSTTTSLPADPSLPTSTSTSAWTANHQPVSKNNNLRSLNLPPNDFSTASSPTNDEINSHNAIAEAELSSNTAATAIPRHGYLTPATPLPPAAIIDGEVDFTDFDAEIDTDVSWKEERILQSDPAQPATPAPPATTAATEATAATAATDATAATEAPADPCAPEDPAPPADPDDPANPDDPADPALPEGQEYPSLSPSISSHPSAVPSKSLHPSNSPSSKPSRPSLCDDPAYVQSLPSSKPSAKPSQNPSVSLKPSGFPSSSPSRQKNCMDDIFGDVSGCQANDIVFQNVTGVNVKSAGATFNTTTGLWQGACRGSDDNVRLSFTADVLFKSQRYDVGMYIALDGGNAKSGYCALATLSEGSFANGQVVMTELEGDAADNCLDVTADAGGTILTDYEFAEIVLACTDADNNGKLDFGVGIVWQSTSGNFCDKDDLAHWPVPNTKSKCWGGTTKSRFNVNVEVPDYLTPTSQPSDAPSISSQPSDYPSQAPSKSAQPSLDPTSSPSISSKPSLYPSSVPSISIQPTDSPSDYPSKEPSVAPSQSPSLSVQPSSEPSESPSESMQPSDAPSGSPSLSAKPSASPSNQPSISLQPTDVPSESPSVSSVPSRAPSSKPSVSFMPSSKPSSTPSESLQPTDVPSGNPTLSAMPSGFPSNQPSLSLEPSKAPSDSPSLSSAPSKSPSSSPSISTQPSDVPSGRPSLSSVPTISPSEQPSVSAHPSTATEYPSISPTSRPSSMPSEEPSISPSLAPSARPSSQPSSSPSLQPSKDPSMKPSVSPSLYPSASPSNTPSVSPSMSPSLVPSDRPSSQPSVSPSISSEPSSAPSDKPSASPTSTPSSSPSASPTDGPTASPTSSPSSTPSAMPSIVEEIVTTPGSLSTNVDICTLSGNELAAFTRATLATIRNFACVNAEDTSSCYADITSVCGSGRRRELSSSSSSFGQRRELSTSSSSIHRKLQGSSWQLEYEVTEIFTCEVANCKSPSDIAAVKKIVDTVSTNMNDSISSGSFLSTLSTNILQDSELDGSITICLIVWGTVGEPETVVGDTGTGVFYPDWEEHSGTCLEDGNEPDYMKNNTVWLFDSLESCCAKYFPGWNNNKCLNPKGSGLWYVDHNNGKCVTDCEVGNGKTCGGLANPISNDLFTDPRSCCQSELFYRFIEFCEADSFQSTCYAGTKLWYRGDDAGVDVCVRDCDPASGDVTCGGLVEDDYVVLHDTAEACCSSEYNWIDNTLCAIRSSHTGAEKYWPDRYNAKCVKDFDMPPDDLDLPLFDSLADCCASSQGIFWLPETECFIASGANVTTTTATNKFYVDWELNRCMKDCEGDAPCGGLAESWEVLYELESDCCARIPWVSADECIYTS